LEVFAGEGANWSYVRPSDTDERLVAETAEKRAISNLCCTGLYHFRREDFLWALAAERAQPQATELYVAPIYNHLIRRGARVGYEVIGRDEVIFCGTPAEYEQLLNADSL
jgi:dTDP-glucose pyrophosphorylase